jgi:hypothetical protein
MFHLFLSSTFICGCQFPVLAGSREPPVQVLTFFPSLKEPPVPVQCLQKFIDPRVQFQTLFVTFSGPPSSSTKVYRPSGPVPNPVSGPPNCRFFYTYRTGLSVPFSESRSRNPTVRAESRFPNPTIRAGSAGGLKRGTVASDGRTDARTHQVNLYILVGTR